MFGTFTGIERDDFGKEQYYRRSLLLDAVTGNRERASRSRLLQLPAEILAQVVDLLVDDKPALAALALVNSDCRHLAHCCQFAEVDFDYSPAKYQLLLALTDRGRRVNELPTIGACVRRVFYAPRPANVARLHWEFYQSIFGDDKDSYTTEKRDELRREGNEIYENLRAVTITAISSFMPNLETLIWEDRYSLDANFFKAITRSSARHIKLSNVFIAEAYSLVPPLTPDVWPIYSLDLEANLEDQPITEGMDMSLYRLHRSKNPPPSPMSTFFLTLFNLCAPTLESLSWTFSDYSLKGPILFGSNPPTFPNLRCLRLRLDSSLPYAPGFSSLLSSPLRHLELSRRVLFNYASDLAEREPLRDLESFVISSLPASDEVCKHVADFITQHHHLQKLSVNCGYDMNGEPYLDRFIVPALEQASFGNLRSLSLAWGGGSMDEETRPHESHISRASLEIIGRILSLEQLSLSAGCITGWRHQWLVDHRELRACLTPLRRLRRLALNRDTYRSVEGREVEQYYHTQYVGPSERVDAEARPELDMQYNASESASSRVSESAWRRAENLKSAIWERAHRNRMLVHAEAYAEVLPELEWMLCGQRPIGFQNAPFSPNGRRLAVPLTALRDECYTFLERTFGLGE